MRTGIRLLGAAVIAFLGYAVMMHSIQASLVFHPTTRLEATPAAIGLAYQDVDLLTDDGVPIHGWFLPHPSPRATLLFLHGNAGNISGRLTTLQLFHDLGLAVLIIDYRGFGRSLGEPTEQGTYRDAQAAWTWLVEQQRLDPAQIMVFGRSLGGGVASWLAEQHPAGGLLLESTFTSLPDIGSELYPLLPVRWLSRYQYPSLERLPNIRSPLWVGHSPDDGLIAVHHGERLFAAGNPPKVFFEMSGGHNDGFIASGQAYRDSLDAFFSRYAGGARSSEP